MFSTAISLLLFQWGLGNTSYTHVFPQSSQSCPEKQSQSQAFLQPGVAQTLGLFPHSQYSCKHPVDQVIDLRFVQDQMKRMNPWKRKQNKSHLFHRNLLWQWLMVAGIGVILAHRCVNNLSRCQASARGRGWSSGSSWTGSAQCLELVSSLCPFLLHPSPWPGREHENLEVMCKCSTIPTPRSSSGFSTLRYISFPR